MNQLKLHYDLLKGEFSLEKLNFLFVFQVNCPGCFMYGIPMVNALYEKYQDQYSFLGLSTAFEDFEFNNEANTIKLLERQQLVGITRKRFGQKAPTPIDFPVAMDQLADSNFDYAGAAERMGQMNPNYANWPQFEKEELRSRILHYLTTLEEIAITFTLNQFRGTPSFVIFNDKMEVLVNEFGHVEGPVIESRMQELIKQNITTH